MTELVVTAFGERCGRIEPVPNSLEYEFAYDDDWRPQARHGISLSMPRRAGSFTDTARAYFGGLLPEGFARRHIAQASGIDEIDDVALLRLLGEECPGAIRIYTPERFDAMQRAPEIGAVDWLDHAGEQRLLGLLRVPGTATAVDRYSISLAGAQLKRGVRIEHGADAATLRVGLPSGAERSTHILKLAVPGYDGIVQNEHATMRLANAVGVRTSHTQVASVGGEVVLLVERYDRPIVDGRVSVLHQEDFCQALGRLPTHKYERFDPETGQVIGPTIDDLVGVLRVHARPSVQQVDELLRTFWFNIVVGNVDAHAKNYSLLYRSDLDAIEMAPLYDSICITAHHYEVSLDERRRDEPLAMNVGGYTRFWALERAHVEAFARSLRVQPGYVLRFLARLVDNVDGAVDAVIDECRSSPVTDHPVLEQVRDEIHRRCAFLHGILER